MIPSMIRQLSIAAPAYNESENARPVLDEWCSYLREKSSLDSFEIVICNDGSEDETGEILRELADATPQLIVVDHARNRGAAVALSTAIAHTTRPWVLLMDLDGQFPIAHFAALEAKQAELGCEAVLGARTRKLDSAFARLGSSASGWLCNRFHGTSYRDFNSAFKLVDGDLLRGLVLEAKGLNYSTEITSKILESGAVMAEVAVEARARARGRSSRKAVRGAIDRFLLVAHIGLRQLMLRLGILERPEREGAGR